MWRKAFDKFLNGMMVHDQLTVRFHDGTTCVYGPDTGSSTTLHFADDAVVRALCLNPSLALGEAYMDERVTLPETGLEETLKLLYRNRTKGGLPAWLRARNYVHYRMRRFIQRNTPHRARANVAHHYDLSDNLYRLFLDADMQYSCGYFSDPDMSLEEAQIAKKSLIARKLCLTQNCHVLDIGCGWGGMALTLAKDFGAHVTGITLSENQLAAARQRAQRMGLSDRVTFELQDYRHIKGRFDRIVSVGMLEHVGVPNYDTYFSRVADLLKPEGVALVHTIGRSAPPIHHDPWINKYIFPGGYVPSLSEIAGPLDRSGLWQCDIEIWRLHYALTLRHWRDRFDAHEAEILKMNDARFVRMFRYYFTVCIVAFEDQMQAVYQFQLAHSRSAVPLTRNYLFPAN